MWHSFVFNKNWGTGVGWPHVVVAFKTIAPITGHGWAASKERECPQSTNGICISEQRYGETNPVQEGGNKELLPRGIANQVRLLNHSAACTATRTIAW